jgi:drug/metabolite transporter (DMT)-like permease
MSQYKGEIAVISSAILMGSLPIFVRNIALNPASLAFFRLFVATLILATAMVLMREWPVLVEVRKVLLLGTANAVTIVSYIAAIQNLQAAMAAILLYMAPVYVLIYSMFRGEVSKSSLMALPLCMLGLYLALSPYGEVNKGLIFGIVSGLAYSVFFILIKELRKFYPSLQLTFLNVAIASILLSPSLFVLSGNFNLVWVAALGIIPTAIPFFLLNYGMKFTRLDRAPILALIEPVAAGFFGFIILNEVLTFKQLIGAAFVLAGIIFALRD